MLIGVAGEKFSGKDTFAKTFTNVADGLGVGMKTDHFARALKEICSSVFNVPMSFFTDVSLKEAPFNTPIIIDDYIDMLSLATGLNIRPRGLVADTPRRLLQYVGTEYVRKVKNSYWMDKMAEVADHHDNLIIPDARFDNEVEFVINRGGILFEILRIDKKKEGDTKDVHASESGVSHVDIQLGVKTGDLAITYMAATCLLTTPELLPLYDYRNLEKVLTILDMEGSMAENPFDSLHRTEFFSEPVPLTLEAFQHALAIRNYYRG